MLNVVFQKKLILVSLKFSWIISYLMLFMQPTTQVDSALFPSVRW